MSEERKVIQVPQPISTKEPVVGEVMDPQQYSRHRVNHYLVVGVGEDNFQATIDTIASFLEAEGQLPLEYIANVMVDKGYDVRMGEAQVDMKEMLLKKAHEMGASSDENIYIAYQRRKPMVDLSRQLPGKTTVGMELVLSNERLDLAKFQEEGEDILEGIAVVRLGQEQTKLEEIKNQVEQGQLGGPQDGSNELANSPFLQAPAKLK